MRAACFHSRLWFGMLSLTLVAWSAAAKPRPPLPPWPEGELARWRFDTTNTGGAFLTENLSFSESWSGWALDLRKPKRAVGLAGRPVRWPGLNLSPSAGTLRFWFSPASTNGADDGSKAAASGRLLEIGTWTVHGSRMACSLGFAATDMG